MPGTGKLPFGEGQVNVPLDGVVIVFVVVDTVVVSLVVDPVASLTEVG